MHVRASRTSHTPSTARRLAAVALATAMAWSLAGPASAGVVPEPVDCTGPVEEAEPGTAAWTQRDTENIWCAEQRLRDTAGARVLDPDVPRPLRDTARDPDEHHGVRFRFAHEIPLNRGGAELPADLFLPCTTASCPEPAPNVAVADGPYPAVLIVHGGASAREHMWWAAQTLAESGYLAIAFDVAEQSGGDHGIDAQDMVDWMFSPDFPFAEEIDLTRVGIAGHSQGASTASLLGQTDDRLRAIVAWDNLTAVTDPELWVDDISVEPPTDLTITTPALGMGADYYFTPKAATEHPEPAPSNGEGGRGRGVSTHPKHLGFAEVRDADVDTMLVVLRAATHLDWTPFTEQASSRYGGPVAAYLTLAWFDRYLAGLDDPALAQDAHERLLALTFDDSSDVHNISTGVVDPETGNQPIQLDGLSVCDRMSFYWSSRLSLHAPTPEGAQGQRLTSEDLRSDCYAASGPYAAAAPAGSDDPAPDTDDAAADADPAADGVQSGAAPAPLAATGGGGALLAVAALAGAAMFRRRTT